MNPTKKVDKANEAKTKPVNVLTISDKFSSKPSNDKLKKPLSKGKFY
jgi:hypothetical protein